MTKPTPFSNRLTSNQPHVAQPNDAQASASVDVNNASSSASVNQLIY